jgi:myosin heavy subunit
MKAPRILGNPTFIIVHTAKDVEYTITGFRTKNKDETSQLLLDVLETAGGRLVSELFVKSDTRNEKFLASKIRKQMAELMKELNSCDCHFIRCIKPNELKRPNIMSETMTLNQIRYLGVLDSLKVRKESYPMRRTFKMFYKQFADMGND